LLCLLNQSVGDSFMLLCIISAHSAVGHFLLQAWLSGTRYPKTFRFRNVL